jgi:rhamnose transport system permease protein
MIKRVLLTREGALFLALFVVFTGFALTVDGFFDWFNIMERSRYWVVAGMIAVPMTFIIATAGIDLSVGSMLALSGIVMGVLFRDAGVSVWLACIGGVLVGTAAGAFNGAVISYLRVPPLVVTLATMALFSGLAMGLSKADPVSGFPLSFQWLAQGDVLEIPLASGPVFVPAPLIALAVTVIVGMVLIRYSWIGRFSECIGENEIAAAFAAIDVRRLTLWLYTACGFVCGCAASVYTALYATARPDAAKGLELEVIACVVVGGTRISGGQASVLGSLLGLLLIGILRYGLEMAGVKSQHLVIVVGVLLIVMVVFNEWMARRSQQ